MVQGHVGAWGGVIIAVFAGVTDNNGSFIGELWYLIAIAAGILVHIALFRSLIAVKGHEKLGNIFNKEKVQVHA
jgi:PTS system fructose-specific IIC component